MVISGLNVDRCQEANQSCVEGGIRFSPATLEERFQWPLAAAILCLAAYLLAGPFRQEVPS